MKDLLINNLEFANQQGQLDGEIDIVDLDRLSDIVSNYSENTQKIRYQLTGYPAKYHLPSLHLTISVVLPVICQRCLDNMAFKLSLAYDYVLSASEPESFIGDEAVDWLELSRQMNLKALIEDEILMALPPALVHESDCAPTTYQSGEKHNPFAALQNLKKKP